MSDTPYSAFADEPEIKEVDYRRSPPTSPHSYEETNSHFLDSYDTPGMPICSSDVETASYGYGKWNNELYSFCDNFSICSLTLLCAPYRWSLTVSSASLLTFAVAFLIMTPFWMIYEIGIFVQFDTHIKAINIMLAAAWVSCALLVTMLGCVYRGRIRDQYHIPGDQCEDCITWLFCPCCAIAQEAKHIESAEDAQSIV